MDWSDRAIVLAARPHAETAAVVELLTESHGRHAGLVHGGRGRRMRPVLQPGNRVRATWRARLSEHLGTFTLEPEALRAGVLMEDAAALEGLASACALASLALPEREPHPSVFHGLEAFLDALETVALWPALLAKWEAGLLADLGYGLDLSRCALTGRVDDLTHVSPKTGRAVCGMAPEAAPYRDKLLLLPPFLLGAQAALAPGDVKAALALTGHFLERRLLWPADRTLPEARARLLARLEEQGRL